MISSRTSKSETYEANLASIAELETRLAASAAGGG
jgi:hypothetical protein